MKLPRNWNIEQAYHAKSRTIRHFILLRVRGEWEYLHNEDYTPINFQTRDAAVDRLCIERDIRLQRPRYRTSTFALYGTAI